MSSEPETAAAQRAPHANYLSDQTFFTTMALALAGIIVFGFLQWAARGFVNVATVPLWVHLHGLLMLTWLGLLVTQNLLVQSGNLALHRTLGSAAVLVVAAVVIVGSYTGYGALALHRVPPFFSNAYFLALTQVEMLAFGAMTGWAVSRRRDTQWHRRLMLGGTVILLEPALGRLLPMPLLGGWAEWLVMLLQLALLAVIMRHDRRVLGAVHPATLCSAAAVVATHVTMTALSLFPPFIAHAEAIAAG